MHFTDAAETLGARFPTRIKTIDSHTAGETTSLVIGMQSDIPGETMRAKRKFFIENWDATRKLLTYEPRGLGEVFVAVVTEPVTRGADFGLIYMDAHRYPYLCGHATIGAVTTLIEAGLLDAGEGAHSVVVDTPSGPMAARAAVEKGRVLSVAINMVPSFVQSTDCSLYLPDRGNISVSLVCVGGFFAMVPVKQFGLQMIPENRPRFIQLGMEIIAAANDQFQVRHPTRPEVNTVDVAEFYNPDATDADRHTGIVIYGESHMDRSPCGTGTAAKMTLLHHLGELQINEPYLNTGPLGTVFQGRIIEEPRVGDTPAVLVEIEGRAHITGWHEFVLAPDDPFPEGFRL